MPNRSNLKLNEDISFEDIESDALNEWVGLVASIALTALAPYAMDYFTGNKNAAGGVGGARKGAAAESMINSNAKFTGMGRIPKFGRVARILGRFTKFAAPIALIMGASTYLTSTEGGKDEYQIEAAKTGASLNSMPLVTMMSVFGVRKNEYPIDDKKMKSLLENNAPYIEFVQHMIQVSHNWAWAWAYGDINNIIKMSSNAKSMDTISKFIPVTWIIKAAKQAHNGNIGDALSTISGGLSHVPTVAISAADDLLSLMDEVPDAEQLKSQAAAYRKAIGEFWNYFSGDRIKADVNTVMQSSELDESFWDTAARKSEDYISSILNGNTASFKSMLVFTHNVLDSAMPFSYMSNIDYNDMQSSMDALSEAGFGDSYNYGDLLKLANPILDDLDVYFDGFSDTNKWTWQRIFKGTPLGNVQQFMIAACAVLTVCDKIEGKHTFNAKLNYQQVQIKNTNPTVVSKDPKFDEQIKKIQSSDNANAQIAQDPSKVKELQKTLDLISTSKGGPAVSITGKMDDSTKKALIEFQKKNGIAASGAVDDITRNKIKDVLKTLVNI